MKIYDLRLIRSDDCFDCACTFVGAGVRGVRPLLPWIIPTTLSRPIVFKNIYLLIILLLIIGTLSKKPDLVSACEPVDPHFWFVARIHIGNTTLPANIQVVEEMFDIDYYHPLGIPGFRIVNDSSFTAQLLPNSVQLQLQEAGTHANGQAILKELAEQGLAVPSQEEKAFIFGFGDYAPNYLSLNRFAHPNLKDRNTQADGRDQPAPDPQTAQLTLVVDGSIYIIPITLTYEDNPFYNPTLAEDSAAECYQFMATTEASFSATLTAEAPQGNGSKVIAQGQNSQPGSESQASEVGNDQTVPTGSQAETNATRPINPYWGAGLAIAVLVIAASFVFRKSVANKPD